MQQKGRDASRGETDDRKKRETRRERQKSSNKRGEEGLFATNVSSERRRHWGGNKVEVQLFWWSCTKAESFYRLFPLCGAAEDQSPASGLKILQAAAFLLSCSGNHQTSIIGVHLAVCDILLTGCEQESVIGRRRRIYVKQNGTAEPRRERLSDLLWLEGYEPSEWQERKEAN